MSNEGNDNRSEMKNLILNIMSKADGYLRYYFPLAV